MEAVNDLKFLNFKSIHLKRVLSLPIRVSLSREKFYHHELKAREGKEG